MHATRALMNKPEERSKREKERARATMRQTSSQLTSNANRRSSIDGERGAHEEMQSNTQRIWHVYTKTHCQLHAYKVNEEIYNFHGIYRDS